MIAGLFAAVAVTAGPAPCQAVLEDVETVAIDGTLEDKGDWVALRPDPPVCVALAGTPTPFDDASTYGEIDVFFTGGRAAFEPAFGRPVRVRGRLAGAHTEDHNTDILIVVTEDEDIMPLGGENGRR